VARKIKATGSRFTAPSLTGRCTHRPHMTTLLTRRPTTPRRDHYSSPRLVSHPHSTPFPPLSPLPLSRVGDGLRTRVPPPRGGAVRARRHGLLRVAGPPRSPRKLHRARPRLVRHLPGRLRDPRVHLHCRYGTNRN
jgi:hypothetical protein